MRRYPSKLRTTAAALVLVAALGGALALRAAPEREAATSAPSPVPTAEATPIPEATTSAPSPEATAEATSASEATASPAPEAQKLIALTFDDGPGPGTRRILDALDAVGGHATFFMLGERVEDYAQTARLVMAQGSEVATHSWAHPNLTRLGAEALRGELERSVEAIERITGARPELLRPPYGSVDGAVQRASGELGLAIANWNVDPEDWKLRDAEAICRSILRDARDGAIVVCHDLYEETAAAVEAAVAQLSAQGYRLVTVSELLEARRGGGQPGEIYYGA